MKINLNKKISNNFNNLVDKCKINYNNFVTKHKCNLKKYRDEIKSRQAEFLLLPGIGASVIITLFVLNIFIYIIFNDSSLISNIFSGLYKSFIGYLISVFTGTILNAFFLTNSDGEFYLSLLFFPILFGSFSYPWLWPMIITYLIPFFNFYYNLI